MSSCTTPPRRPRLYVAGPMTGLPGLNFPAFIAATLQLRGLGFDVVNPVELNPGPGPADQHSAEYAAHWRQCMRVDIQALVQCDGVALLPGWERSRGAKLERLIADALGLRVLPLSTWLLEATTPRSHHLISTTTPTA